MKDTFALAAEEFAELVGRISGRAWTGPGLGEWDLRSLVGHTSRSLITVDTYLDRPAESEAVASPDDYYRAARAIANADSAAVTERGRQAGLALGDDPVAAVRSLVDRVVPRVYAVDDPLIETIAGGMRLSTYLPTRVLELVVHSLDIASATELTPLELPPELLRVTAELAARAAVAQGDGALLIRGLTGRGDLPVAYSVV